jgi:hypothetical protein
MTDFRSMARGALLGLLCTGVVAVTTPAHAAIVGTEALVSVETRASDLATITNFLDRDVVRAEMERFGVNSADAAERVAALSDAELRQLAQGIGQQPAGAGVIEVVGIVFVVLLILELVGVTNIFTRF